MKWKRSAEKVSTVTAMFVRLGKEVDRSDYCSAHLLDLLTQE
jgi:hypothetical protein